MKNVSSSKSVDEDKVHNAASPSNVDVLVPISRTISFVERMGTSNYWEEKSP